MKEYTFKEWEEEGEKRFGKDKTQWKFICPKCGHVQTAQDFMNKNYGPELAYCECMSRYSIDNGGCDLAVYKAFGTGNKGVILKYQRKASLKIEIFDFAPMEV